MSSLAKPFRATRRLSGFTLVEVMIGASIGSYVLLGMLTMFGFLGRSGARLTYYNAMALESRRALDEFSQDVRMASDVVANLTVGTDIVSSVTLTVPDNYGGAYANKVTYAYDSATSGATKRSFYRVAGTPAQDVDTPSRRVVLARNVTACTYTRRNRLDDLTTSDASTKRLELTLRISTTAIAGAATGMVNTVAATENAISATYLLRNKLAN
jgi:Tfp pilus assembly protein PilW